MQDCRSTVLLLGDESDSRRLLAEALCSRGYQVLRARSAHEAEHALSTGFEMVVVDQRVRGTNGLAWIKRLRERGYKMPVVFCSGSNCSVKTFNLLRNLLNVSIIVRKPLVPLTLVDQMECLLDGSASGGYAVSSSSDPADLSDSSDLIDHSDLNYILQFDPPAESEQEAWLRDYQEELETKKALEKLGRQYLADMPEKLYELREQISAAMVAEDNNDLLKSAISTAHQIKGTAGSLSFPALSRMAAEIEVQLKGFSADNKSTDRQPMALALVVVASIESWLEDWQDSNEILIGRELASWAQPAKPLPETFPQFVQPSVSPFVSPPVSPSIPEVSADSLPDPIKLSLAESSGVASERDPERQKEEALLAYIVDSDAERVQILANVLRAQGNWQVETVSSGIRVLAALEECRPELLILDEAGGQLSGVDICRMIRCHPKWALLPVIVVTADTSEGNRRLLYMAGATDFIVKPLVGEELANRLLGLFRNKLQS